MGPCKIIEKYGANAYKVDLPSNLGISPIFNVQDLVKFKGPLAEVSQNSQGVSTNLEPIVVPSPTKLEAKKILDLEVKKTTRHKVYMEQLIKWRHKPNSEAT